MNHRVINVDLLYTDSINMYKMIVIGNADVIIKDLAFGINNLKENWHGMDAGVQIQDVIIVHNDLVFLRNKLAELSQIASLVASKYKHLQNLNNNSKTELIPLKIDLLNELPAYFDFKDTIYMNPNVFIGKESIDRSKEALQKFASQLNIGYNNIMDNWIMGSGRKTANQEFEKFKLEVNEYIKILDSTSNTITKALQNYTSIEK